jgi:hypothetical protein
MTIPSKYVFCDYSLDLEAQIRLETSLRKMKEYKEEKLVKKKKQSNRTYSINQINSELYSRQVEKTSRQKQKILQNNANREGFLQDFSADSWQAHLYKKFEKDFYESKPWETVKLEKKKDASCLEFILN